VRHWARSLCTTQAPQEFGNSRKDVLLIGAGLLVAGFGSYYAMLVRPYAGRAPCICDSDATLYDSQRTI
jgi:hypothetical protein